MLTVLLGLVPADQPAPAPPGEATSQSCQAALGRLSHGTPEETLPGRINGDDIAGSDALTELRRQRGDALITIVGGSFRGADFRGAALHNICFLDTNFEGSDWRGADAPGVGFIRANLTGATLAGAKMSGIMLRQPVLARVDALGADWSGGRLDGNAFTDLDNLRLDRSNLGAFTFDCGITQGDDCGSRRSISFRGADLTGARIDSFWNDADWVGARFDGTVVSLGQLSALAAVDLAGPVIVRGGDRTARLTPAEVGMLLSHVVARDGSGEAPVVPGPAAWLRPGATALFVAPRIHFDAALAETPLYRRLLPVLIESASARLFVRVNGDGSVDAEGDAIGGNAHMCSLSGRNFVLDPATGWFSGPEEGEVGAPPRGKRLVPVLSFAGDHADVFENGHATVEEGDPWAYYASCGARVGFARMIRVPVAPEEVERAFAAPREP